MASIRFNNELITKAYNIECLRYDLGDEKDAVPFHTTWCRVEPDGNTSRHAHPEGEVFFILEGKARVEVEGKSELLSEGDFIHIPSFHLHQVNNASNSKPLLFLSQYWEPNAPEKKTLPARALCFAAPPTPNGDLHLGHLAGPYLAWDVMSRYLRLRGCHAISISGTDDNQSFMVRKAETMQLPEREASAHFRKRIESDLKRAGIVPDVFLQSSDDRAGREFVCQFVDKLQRQGQLIAKEREELHCVQCDMNLYAGLLSGRCPHCEANCYGYGCEACGLPNSGNDLLDPKCGRCGSPAERISGQALVFDVERFRPFLTQYWAKLNLSGPGGELVSRFLELEKFPEIAVAHRGQWGISLQRDQSQVIYEWVEMAAMYQYAEKSALAGCADQSTPYQPEIFWFFGVDNAFNYLALVPSLLLAHDEKVRLPSHYVINAFYQLEGQKFSTSRQHAVWVNEAMQELPSDLVRLFLACTRPEHEETNFGFEFMQQFVNRELVGKWGAWVREVQQRGQLLSFGGHELAKNQFLPEHWSYLEALRSRVSEIERAYSPAGFSLRAAVRGLGRFVEDAVELSRPWANAGGANGSIQRFAKGAYLEVCALRAFAGMLMPLAPNLADAISRSVLREGTELEWPTNFLLDLSEIAVASKTVGFFDVAAKQVREFCEKRGRGVATIDHYRGRTESHSHRSQSVRSC